jgi:Fic family protein
MDSKSISQKITTFHERVAPEEGYLVGYGAIIAKYDLKVTIPHKLALISFKKRQYKTKEWQVYTPRHQPGETLFKQLVFALKYEGVNLLVLKKLFDVLETQEIEELVRFEPLSQYGRRLWFIYEWLFGSQLNIPDLDRGNFVPLLDEEIQFAVEGKRSSRHRILNNLPGTPEFCPLVYKTSKLEQFISAESQTERKAYIDSIHKDVMQRAASFLLLKDSKASFTIEGENPGPNRALRWGRAIGEAGKHPLTREELLRLQQIIIESKRFTKMGFRKEGGYVGDRDRTTGDPIPDHISAKWQDLDGLMDGLIQTCQLLEREKFDPVFSAAIVAFGFVFIHPFYDGNGRLHRYLIHHILARMNFTQQGIVFPISASILDKINDYRIILEDYSHPVLELIDWEVTPDHNVMVRNDTIDYYRYFDATSQAEFLVDCVLDTTQRIIPEEVSYILKYDEFKRFIDNRFEMPDKLVDTLVRFLEQNNGQLSNRARGKEFSKLKDKEVTEIEKTYLEIFKES